MEREIHPPYQFLSLQKVLDLKHRYANNRQEAFAHPKEDRILSVGTYNVHMWMDPFDNESAPLREVADSVDRILGVINDVRPDVLFLQEFAPADFHFNGRLVRAGKAIPAL